MELYILSKQDLSILSICKLADYQINLDEETNAKSTFTLMKTNGLKKENYMVLNGLYRQFIFVIDDVQTEKGSNVVTVTALDISNIFDRKVIEKNIDTMKSKSIEEFLANTISENFVNSDDTALNVNYIEIYWHTNTKGNVATNSENGLYNFHTFLTNCRQYKNIYTDFKLENLGNPQTVEGKRISVEAKNRKIVDISLHGESTQNGTPTPDSPIEIENIEGKNKFSGFVKGIAINPTDGHQLANETRASSDYIAVDFNKNPNYYLSGLANTLQTFVAAYNSNKKFLGRTGAVLVSYFSLNSSSFTLGTAQGTGDIAYLRVTTYENTPSGTTGAIDDVDNLETQLETGTIATPYVPYNSLEIKDIGENLFNPSNAKDGYVNDNNGQILGVNIKNKNTGYIKIDGGEKYFILSNKLSGNWGAWYDKDKRFISGITLGAVDKGIVTAPNNAYFINFTVSYNNNNPDYANNVMIARSDKEILYKPYQEQTVYFQLSEGQKLMEGSYLADDGIHHRRKQRTISITNIITATNGNICGVFNISDKIKKNNNSLICSNAIFDKNRTFTEGTVYENQLNVVFVGNSTDTLETIKAKYDGAILEYELAEPETVPYTAEQQEAWNKIKNITLFEGVNHISSDANMVLKYYPLESVGLKFVLRIDIENKQETTKLIDTTLPEVTDYNKVYEEDVTAKVTAYIRENNTEYNLYLKTDRTTTTNKNDTDRASGKIEVISVDTADKAEEEALNVMKGNNYKHLVEFKIAKTSKLMDITKLHIRKTYKNQNRRRYI